MMAGPSRTPQELPKTIEDATRRYLYSYNANFRGSYQEQQRLSDICESKIVRLRKKAPKFYQEKLPTLVNQAASELLTCDTRTSSGQNKFNTTHANFLRILDELTRSQPADEINFQKERERAQERDRLLEQQLKLRSDIEKLEAFEFDGGELGDSDMETEYMKVFQQLDVKKTQLQQVSHVIAAMEGHRIEEDGDEVKLKVAERTLLSQLSKDELQELERQITQFLKENQNKKTSFYVEKTIIDGMLEKLKLSERFQPVQINQLSKEVLDSYRSHFREKDRVDREEWHAHLLSNKVLRPKEGRILKGPDDIPDDVKLRLDRIDSNFKQSLEDELEKWAKRPCDDVIEESVEYDNDDEGDEEDCHHLSSVRARVDLEKIKNIENLFSRIKEEPRDDYNNEAPSDDEIQVRGEMGRWLEGEELIHIDDDISIVRPRKKACTRPNPWRREECSDQEEIPDCDDDEDEDDYDEEDDNGIDANEDQEQVAEEDENVEDEEEFIEANGEFEQDELEQDELEQEELEEEEHAEDSADDMKPKVERKFVTTMQEFNNNIKTANVKNERKVSVKDEKKPLITDHDNSDQADDDSDDDIEVLGIVEPTDKVHKMNVD